MENYLTVERCNQMSNEIYRIMKAIEMQRHALEEIGALIRCGKEWEAKKVMIDFVNTAYDQDQDIHRTLDEISFNLLNAGNKAELEANS